MSPSSINFQISPAQSTNDGAPNNFSNSLSRRILVKTKEYGQKEEDKRPIDLTGVSNEDIQVLHEIDPFLYYTILEGTTRKYTRTFQDPEEDEGINHLPAGQCTSTTAKRVRRTITRRTSISTEAHPYLIMENLLNED